MWVQVHEYLYLSTVPSLNLTKYYVAMITDAMSFWQCCLRQHILIVLEREWLKY